MADPLEKVGVKGALFAPVFSFLFWL